METKGLPAEELLANKIFYIRGQKVRLDRDLAELYSVPTEALKQLLMPASTGNAHAAVNICKNFQH